MAVFETWLKSDLKKPLKVTQLEGNLFSQDNGGNLIGAEVTDGGQAATLSGNVTGYFMRADGETVVIVGTLSGNRASIVLPASAYVVVGQASIVIKVGDTTVGACVGYVYRTTTDAIVDPGRLIPSLADLLAQIETMRELNQTVTNQEAGRVTAESGRVQSETNRETAETARASAETARASAETARAAAETARASAETDRATAETGRATAETGRVSAESGRATAETARDTAETARGTAEAARSAAETARATAETARETAETARAAAETQRATDTAAAIAAAGSATSAANTAAGKIDNMTVEGQTGTTTSVTISEVNGHKHISFTVQKGDKGDPGKDFEIRKTFSSIAQMQAYDPETDPSTKKVRENDFVMIDTGSVQDADTGKLFCYEPSTQDVWRYIGDLSGSQGIKGETGTGIANITLNQDYTLTITMDDGNYYTTASIRGAQGPAGVSPTVAVSTVTGGHQVDVTDAQGVHTFVVLDGADGTSAYCYIRYSHTQPTQDSDMGTTADDWMGIYSGTSSTPPTTYTSYTWYKIKGETGSVQNVYATTIPMSDQDSTKISAAIAAKMDALNAAAPYDNTATYAEGAYCFHDGLKKCTTAITTAEEWTAAHWTSTTIAAELQSKVDANQGAGNAGKALGIDNQGNVVPVPFSGEDFTGATDQAAGVHGYVPAPATGDQGKFLKGDGSWGTVPNPQNMGGATAQTAGTAGLAPAPAAGDQGKFLRGDGSWANTPYPGTMTGATASTDGASGLVPAPLAGGHKLFLKGDGSWDEPDGVRLYVADLDAVTNTSGSYTHTSTVTGMTGDLKAVLIECSNPEIFKDKVTITTGADSVTLTCSEVAGTSSVKVSFAVQGNANPLNSTEYAALDARIGDLSDLTTTDKSSVVDAVNEVNGKLQHAELSVTTTSNGIIETNIDYDSIVLVNAYATSNVSPIPYRYSGGTLRFRAVNSSGGNLGLAKSTSITLYLDYYNRA